MKETGFYPGCSLQATSREYNESVRALARHLSLPLREIEDWNCCGATAAHSMNHELALALPARVLALAEAQGMEEIVVPCAACYGRLATTHHTLVTDETLRQKTCDTIGMEYSGKLKILNAVQWIEQYVEPLLANAVTHPINRKIACYYGCLLVRPHKVLQFDRVEDPQSMDRLCALCGSKPVDWAFKTECCGAGLSISRTQSVGRLSGAILSDAAERGAEAIIVACPMCHSNLDMRRPAANCSLGQYSYLPVLFITQLIGLALGIPRKELGLDRHFVPVPQW